MTAIYGINVDRKPQDLNSSDASLAELQKDEDVEGNRSDSIEIVKSFNVIKTLIWSCTHVVDPNAEEDNCEPIEKEERYVDLELLLDHMRECKLLLDLLGAQSTYGISEKTILKRLTLVRSDEIGTILNNFSEA